MSSHIRLSNSFMKTKKSLQLIIPREVRASSSRLSRTVMLSPSDGVFHVASRLNRLSQLLPRLNTHSKQHQEPQPPVSAQQSPIPTQQPYQPHANPTLSIQLPPSRAPPPTPTSQHAKNSSQSSVSSTTSQKPSTPPQGWPLEPVSANTLTAPGGRPRGNSLAPPQSQSPYVGVQTRVVSTPISSRPTSYHSEGEMCRKRSSTGPSRRRSWLPGGNRSRTTSQEVQNHRNDAWIIAGEEGISYNSSLLTEGERIPELWNEDADTYVYLHPKETGRGPQFKIPSVDLSSSQPLMQLMYGELYSGRARGKSFDGRDSLTIEDATRNLAIRNTISPPYTPRSNENQSTSDGTNESIRSLPAAPREAHLYFPVGLSSVGPELNPTDVQKLIDVRNLFGFLQGQPIVATSIRPTNFRILLQVAQYLKQFQFSNADGSTYGEAVTAAFNFFLVDHQYADVRSSLEKTLEALILGENMRSVELYNEAFAHAAGKFDQIKGLSSPLYDELSTTTRDKLEKSSIALNNRLNAMRDRLSEFQFPSLFSGIGASTTSDESKIVRFKEWKSHFMALRKQVLKYFSGLYGSWPPKPNSKKNNFQTAGLNRLVLKILYKDLCDLYDLLADRNSFTPRGMAESDDKATDDMNPVHAALRKLLAEYDRSSPPVQPPIPYDVPIVPTYASVDSRFPGMATKDQHKCNNRKLKDHECGIILTMAYHQNPSGQSQNKATSDFVRMFQEFEKQQGKNKKTVSELQEMRYGHWIFLYSVIQSLPLVISDAPNLKFTEAVEYFLCMVPLGGLPWVEESAPKKSWYNIQGGTNVVSMPADVVNHGVEATYRQSHCWNAAEAWIRGGANGGETTSNRDSELSPLAPPPGFAGGELGARPSARSYDRNSNGSQISVGTYPESHSRNRSRKSQRNSIALGLERLPIPTGEEYNYIPNQIRGGSQPGSSHGAASRQGSPEAHVGGRAPQVGSADGTPVTGGGGSTFDDILGSMGESKAKKKKSMFF